MTTTMRHNRSGRPAATHTCIHPRCHRPAPCWHSGDHLCSLHDGTPQDAEICLCPTVVADRFRQCTRCWKPVVSLALRGGLDHTLDTFPQLAHQVVVVNRAEALS